METKVLSNKANLLVNVFLVFLMLDNARGAESKKTFVEFWMEGQQCSAVENWKPVFKFADLELPQTKQKPMAWRNPPYIFVAEPTSRKAEAFSNAWMIRDGRRDAVKLPLEKGTISKDLKAIQICLYRQGDYFDLVIPDTDYGGVNPRECELRMLYKFDDPVIKFIAKRCI